MSAKIIEWSTSIDYISICLSASLPIGPSIYDICIHLSQASSNTLEIRCIKIQRRSLCDKVQGLIYTHGSTYCYQPSFATQQWCFRVLATGVSFWICSCFSSAGKRYSNPRLRDCIKPNRHISDHLGYSRTSLDCSPPKTIENT